MRVRALTLAACSAALVLATTTTTLSFAVGAVSTAGATSTDLHDALRCRVCEELVAALRRVADGPGVLFVVEKLAVPVCRRAISRSKVDPGAAACIAPQSSDQCKELCDGMVRSFAPALWHIAVRTKMPSRSLCSHMHMCRAAPSPPPPRYELLRLASVAARLRSRVRAGGDDAEGGAPQRHDSLTGAALSAAMELQRPWLPTAPDHIAHVTDAHVDPLYAPGSRTDCGMPLCCHSRWGAPAREDTLTAAPRYGAVECDIPEETLISTAGAMGDALRGAEDARTADADGVARVRLAVYTGDSPPHDIWRQSLASNRGVTRAVASVLLHGLAGSGAGGTANASALFPVLGNHEGWPVNLFPGPSDVGPEQEKEGVPTAAQVLGAAADAWADFMHGDSFATSSLRAVGYYTALAAPDLRVLALHTTALSTDNPYLSVDSAGASAQLRWVEDVLRYASRRRERVLVIGHAAPPHWRSDLAGAFNDMVRRYSGQGQFRRRSVFAGFMFGHTHHDEWHVLLPADAPAASADPDGGRGVPDSARAVYWVAPAVTAFQGASNPSFRIYDLSLGRDGLLALRDYVQHRADLRAHAGRALEWKAVYRWSAAYNKTSAAPSDVARASVEIMQGSSLYQTFLANRHGGWPGAEESAAQIGKELFVHADAKAPAGAPHRHC